MMNRLFIIIALCCFSMQIHAQNNYVEKMKWWNEAKFGLFVHWGPYCLYGGMYHGYQQRRGGAEWIMNRCKIPVREYQATTTTFNPVDFNAEELVKMAKNAGMKYVVFTSKHHDGFAMYKSEVSKYNIYDFTPFKRDVVDEIAKACKKYDMKFGLYYSHAQDWNHPGGAVCRKEMKEGWPAPDSVSIDKYSKEHKGAWDALQTTRTYDEYFYNVALPQIKELLQRYPDLAILWFDTPAITKDSHAQAVTDLLKKYPNVIVNDRLKRPNYPGDYKTPEGRVPKAEDVKDVYWETCMNVGSSWGWKSYEKHWKSSNDIIKTLIMCASRGGNLLLNVGPDPNGIVPHEAQESLADVGKWLETYGEIIYGSQRSNIHPAWGECIRKDDKKHTNIYLCVYDWPENHQLIIPQALKVRKATMMNGGDVLKTKTADQQTIVTLKERPENEFVTVIKLELRGKLSPINLKRNTDKFFEVVDEMK